MLSPGYIHFHLLRLRQGKLAWQNTGPHISRDETSGTFYGSTNIPEGPGMNNTLHQTSTESGVGGTKNIMPVSLEPFAPTDA